VDALDVFGRTGTPVGITMASLGALVGAGLFVGSGTAISVVGPGVLISYGIAGFVLLALVQLVERSRTRPPSATSITDLAYAGLGSSGGALVVKLYWCFWILVAAIETLAAVNIVAPARGTWGLIAGAGLLTGAAVLGHGAADTLPKLAHIFSALKVGAVLVLSGTLLVQIVTNHFAPLRAFDIQPPLSRHLVPGILAGVSIALFSLAGSDIVHSVTGAGCDPRRALILSSTRVFGIYLAPIGLLVSLLPYLAVQPGISPFIAGLDALHYPVAAYVLATVVLIAITSTLHSALAVCSELLHLIKHPCDASPKPPSRRNQLGNGCQVSAACTVPVLLLAAVSPSRAYAFLVSSASVLLVTTYIFILAALGRMSASGLQTRAPNNTAAADRWSRYALIGTLITTLLAMATITALGPPLLVGLSIVLLLVLLEVAARYRRPLCGGVE
jgi:GABA permease